MMRNLYFLFTFCLFCAVSCNNDDDTLELADAAELEITSGFICGWCAGADSIVIVRDKYAYVKFDPCSDEAFHPREFGDVTADQWNELIQLLDFDTFKSIDRNTCNICVDGCDYWVKVRQGDEIHKVTFGQSKADTIALEPIMPFIEELHLLKALLIK